MDDEPVVVRYHLDLADLKASQDAHGRAQAAIARQDPVALPSWTWLVLVALGAGLFFMGRGGARILLWFFGVISLVVGSLALAAAYLNRRWNRRAYEQIPERTRDQEYEIREADIVALSRTAATRLEWDGVDRVVEDTAGFLIYIGPVQYHWLPLGAFASGADVERFREIAATRGKLAAPKPEPLPEL